MSGTRVYERIVQEDINAGVGTTTITNPGGGSLPAHQVGLHTFGIGQTATTATWNPGAVAAGSYVSTTVTVAGAVVGDFVQDSFTGIAAASILTLRSRVEAADTVRCVISNPTAASITPSSGTLKVLVLKSA